MRQKFDPRLNSSTPFREWANALNAVADLQDALIAVSMDMGIRDDWTWQEPLRDIVRNTWNMISQTPAEKRIEKAEELQEQARKGIALIQERRVHN